MRTLILFILLFSVLSCTKKETPKEELKHYIISEKEREIKEKIKAGNFLPPPKGYYGEFQLVIDSSDNFYCYQREDQSYIWNCIIDENDTLPEFIDLQPKDLLKINSKQITDLINENIMSKPKNRQILVIASQKDTLNDLAFLKFLKKVKVPLYLIRKTTQEEDTVLQYKKNNNIYYSEAIKWDESKIKFQKFLPPAK